ncbi:MAG: hypothetical protein H0U92_05425 [Actinobacteria bacterium]|nr:hypothetical protein [Actinomycetota bacterium]
MIAAIEPIEGGCANDYDYVSGDPVNGSIWLALVSGSGVVACEYMTGGRAAPCGFRAFSHYSPRRLGKGMVGRRSGSCSTHGLIAADAVRAFTNGCKSHDYGYDLLRFAAESGQFSLADRRAADSQLNTFMGGVCGSTGYIGWFNKGRCQLNRAAVSSGLRANTSYDATFGDGVP